MSAGDEAAGRRELSDGMGRHCQSFRLAASDVDGSQPARIHLLDLARWMAEEPARLVGCEPRKGTIAAGYDADFVVFDPDREFVVTEDRLHYRHPFSPYLGEKLQGEVKATYLRGNPVFADGEFPGEAEGREYTANTNRQATGNAFRVRNTSTIAPRSVIHYPGSEIE